MRSSVYKRSASLLICVAFLLSVTFVKPQKADAVALSTAAVVASVAAVMTACGVTYWAATEQDAISYLGGKIDNYLYSLQTGGETITYEEWLDVGSAGTIFNILGNGAISFSQSVANKILGFVRWFYNKEGIVSGSNAVGMSNPIATRTNVYRQGDATYNFENDILTITLTDFCTSNYRYSARYGVVIPVSNVTSNFYYSSSLTGSNNINGQIGFGDGSENADVYSSISLNVNNQVISSGVGYDRLYVELYTSRTSPASYSLVFTFGGLDFVVGELAIVHPTENVSVPVDKSDDQPLVVLTNAVITAGDDQDDAVDAILAQIQDVDGLESSEQEQVSGSWGWLSDLLNDILDAITAIPQSIGSAIQNAISGLTTTVSNIYNSISSFFASIGSTIQSAVSNAITVLQTTITGISSKVDEVKQAILGLPSSIASGISTVLQTLFVPREAFIDTYVATLYSNFDNHFSILSYPFSLLGTFITKVATAGSSEPIISWPNIYEHFSGKLLIAAGSYNLNSILANQAIANMYAIYMIVIKAIISFQFVAFLYAWFCDVFHMNNDDFANPFDIVEETDPEDGDGYDGTWSSW